MKTAITGGVLAFDVLVVIAKSNHEYKQKGRFPEKNDLVEFGPGKDRLSQSPS